MNKKNAREHATAMIDNGRKYGLPFTIKEKSMQKNDCREEKLGLGKPAKQFDIVEAIEGPYHSECKVGERFVALEVLTGDYTVISMDPDGNRVTLCYPEEYVVVGNVEEFNRNWKETIVGFSDKSEIAYMVKQRKDMQ